MSTLGSLVVSLAMDTAKFTAAVGRTSQQMLKLGGQAAKLTGAIASMATSAASTGAVLVQAAINAADANTKAAQAAGLSVEAFTELGYAAGLSGVKTEGLSTALKKLAKSSADTVAGTGDAKDAFKALGIEVQQNDGTLKDQDVLLAELADKFSQYKDGAEKTALAQRVFGKAGAEMIPLLNAGSNGIKAMRQEAIALGVAMDTKTGQAAERFNDNLTRLYSVGGGLANQVARELLPTLENMSTQLVASAKSSDTLQQAARAAAAGVRLLASAGILVGGIFKTLGQSLGGVFAAITQAVQGNFAQAWSTAKSTVFDFGENVKGTFASVGAVWDTVANDTAAKAPGLGAKLAAPAIEAADRAKAAAERALSAIRDPVQQMTQDFLRSEKSAYDLVDAVTESVDYSMSAITDVTQQMTQDFLRSEKAAYELTPVITEIGSNAVRAGERIQDAFGDTLQRTLSGKWDGILADWGNLIQKMISEAIAADLMNSLFGRGTGGNLAGLGSAFMNLFSGGTPHATGLGYVPRDNYHAILHKGERVMTATENRMGGSGSGSVNNIIIQTQPGTRAETSENRNESGGIDTLIRMIDERQAAGIMSGQSKTARAMSGTFGLNRSAGAPRRG